MKGNVHARRRWAQRMIQRCPEPPPKYGTAEWLELPEGDLGRVAAVIIAAEAWALDGDDIEGRLHVEVELEREAFKRAEDAAYLARRDAHRDSWTGRGFRPDPNEPARIEAEWTEWAGRRHLRLVTGTDAAETPAFRDGGRSA